MAENSSTSKCGYTQSGGSGQPNSGQASQARTGATAGVGEDKPKLFDERGAIGKQFTEEGAVGGAAQAIGGPLAKDGMVGQHFTADGSIGGTVQNALGGQTKRSN